MYYAIDFDTRTVESKSTDGELLAAYTLDNKLTASIAIVDNADEIYLQLSLNEMQELSGNLGGDKQYKDDAEAAEQCWVLIEQNQDNIPNYTKSLGKRLLKAAEKRNRWALEAMSSSRDNTPVKAKNPAIDRRGGSEAGFDNAVFELGLEKCKRGFGKSLQIAIEDNLGESTYPELCEVLSSYKDKPHVYIRFAISKEFICLKN